VSPDMLAVVMHAGLSIVLMLSLLLDAPLCML
jgi:hypothetical protein